MVRDRQPDRGAGSNGRNPLTDVELPVAVEARIPRDVIAENVQRQAARECDAQIPARPRQLDRPDAFTDKGAPQPDNVTWNERQRATFAQRVRDIQSQNDQKLTAYRATITIDPEAR